MNGPIPGMETGGKRKGIILLALCLVGWLGWLILVEAAMPSTFFRSPSDVCEWKFSQPFNRVETTHFPPSAKCIFDTRLGEPVVREYIPLAMTAWLSVLSAILAVIALLTFLLFVRGQRPWVSGLLHVSSLFCLGTIATALGPTWFLIVGFFTEMLFGLLRLPGGPFRHILSMIAGFGVSTLISALVAAKTSIALESLVGPLTGDRKGSRRRGAVMGGIAGIGVLFVFVLHKPSLSGNTAWIYPTVIAGLAFASIGGVRWIKAWRH